jgi:hypothetical protein
MSSGRRLMRLDERVLGGRTGVAVVLALIAAGWLTKGGAALVDGAWLLAAVMAVLTVLTAQAALRTWRSRATE